MTPSLQEPNASTNGNQPPKPPLFSNRNRKLPLQQQQAQLKQQPQTQQLPSKPKAHVEHPSKSTIRTGQQPILEVQPQQPKAHLQPQLQPQPKAQQKKEQQRQQKEPKSKTKPLSMLARLKREVQDLKKSKAKLESDKKKEEQRRLLEQKNKEKLRQLELIKMEQEKIRKEKIEQEVGKLQEHAKIAKEKLLEEQAKKDLEIMKEQNYKKHMQLTSVVHQQQGFYSPQGTQLYISTLPILSTALPVTALSNTIGNPNVLPTTSNAQAVVPLRTHEQKTEALYEVPSQQTPTTTALPVTSIAPTTITNTLFPVPTKIENGENDSFPIQVPSITSPSCQPMTKRPKLEQTIHTVSSEKRYNSVLDQLNQEFVFNPSETNSICDENKENCNDINTAVPQSQAVSAAMATPAPYPINTYCSQFVYPPSSRHVTPSLLPNSSPAGLCYQYSANCPPIHPGQYGYRHPSMVEYSPTNLGYHYPPSHPQPAKIPVDGGLGVNVVNDSNTPNKQTMTNHWTPVSYQPERYLATPAYMPNPEDKDRINTGFHTGYPRNYPPSMGSNPHPSFPSSSLPYQPHSNDVAKLPSTHHYWSQYTPYSHYQHPYQQRIPNTYPPFSTVPIQQGPLSARTQVSLHQVPSRPKNTYGQKKDLMSSYLHKNPLGRNSPFAKTHTVLAEPIILIRKPGESFGMSLNVVVESTVTYVKVKSKSLIHNSIVLHHNNDVAALATISTDPSNTPSIIDVSGTLPNETNSNGTLPNETNSNGVEDMTSRPRRQFYCALIVASAEEQTKKKKSLLATADKENVDSLVVGDTKYCHGKRKTQTCSLGTTFLEPNDIILSVDGQPCTGMTFGTACNLFKMKEDIDPDGLIKRSVIVARKGIKLVVPALKTYPTFTTTANPVSTKNTAIPTGQVPTVPVVGPIEAAKERKWTQVDSIALATSVIVACSSMSRPTIGTLLTEIDITKQLSLIDPTLNVLPTLHLMNNWSSVEADLKARMDAQALKYWEKITESYQIDGKQIKLPFLLSDSKLASLRAVPKPANGICKVGSSQYQYVNDPACFLYHKLRELDESESSNKIEMGKKDKAKSKKQVDKMNTVEKGFTDRILRLKMEQEKETTEAEFVDCMEKIQIQKCNQAVFCPSLTAIVLSAVVELGRHSSVNTFRPNRYCFPSLKQEPSKMHEGVNDIESDDDDEDDAVPLAMLKGNKEHVVIRYDFLGKLLRLISEKWGHLYLEPSDMEHSWRWEIFHGENIGLGSKWDAGTGNPRECNSLSLENIRFLLDDKTISGLSEINDEILYCNAVQAIAVCLSPNRSGICDELLALLHTGVLTIDKIRGIPILSNEWYSFVDVLLLSDMQINWNQTTDPVGKYGIIEDIQNLSKFWKVTESGWTLINENELVYDFNDMEEWRAAFEAKHCAKFEGIDGIGRFC